MSFWSRLWSSIRAVFKAPAPKAEEVAAPATVAAPPPEARVAIAASIEADPVAISYGRGRGYDLMGYLRSLGRIGDWGLVKDYFQENDTPADTVARYDAAVKAWRPPQRDLDAPNIVHHGDVPVGSLGAEDLLALQYIWRRDPSFPFRVLSGTTLEINAAINAHDRTDVQNLESSFNKDAYKANGGALAPYL